VLWPVAMLSTPLASRAGSRCGHLARSAALRNSFVRMIPPSFLRIPPYMILVTPQRMRRTDVGLETGLVDQIDIMRAYLIEFTTQLVRIPPITTLWNMYGTLVLDPPVLCPLPKTGLFYPPRESSADLIGEFSSEGTPQYVEAVEKAAAEAVAERTCDRSHATLGGSFARAIWKLFCFSFTPTAPYKRLFLGFLRATGIFLRVGSICTDAPRLIPSHAR
jgi:hypothetical protein